MSVSRPLLTGVVCMTVVLSACGGGGGGGTRSIPALPNAGPAPQAVQVSVVVPAPAPGAQTASSRRKPQFISPSTLGAAMKVANAAGSSTVTFDLSPSSTSCSVQAEQRVCTISVNAPPGDDTFSLTTYDAAPVNGSIPASAHVLGTGSVTQTIGATFTGSLTMYIDASVNGLGALPAFSSLPEDNAAHTYLFVLNPTDFRNNAIVNGNSDPYMNPIGVTLKESGGSGHAQLLVNGSPAGTSATLKTSGDSIAVKYDGGGSPGYAIGVTFSASGIPTMTTAFSPLYVTSTSTAFANLSLQLAGSASTVPFTIAEMNAPSNTTFTVGAATCTNVASVGSPTQNGSSATFSVSGGSASASCHIDVSDGISTVSIAVTNVAPATPTPAPTPTPTVAPTPAPTPSPTPVPSVTPSPTWTTVPLGPSLYVTNGGVGELATYPLTGWTPNATTWPYNTNLTPTTVMDYHNYTAGGLICYDAVHNYVWAISGSTDTVEAYPANAKGTNVPASMTLPVGALNGYPTGCAVDSHGNVYVTAYGAIFSGIPDMLIIYPSGSTTAGTVIRGTQAGLNIPRKPAVDSAGNVYIADSTGKDVRVFTNPGTSAGIIDAAPARTISYEFTNPWGVTTDAAGHVYVADTYGIAGYVEVFPAGTTNAAGSTPIFVLGSGNQIPSSPNGVAIDPYGNLWVACTGELQEFDAASLSSAFTTHIAPNPYASIWGSNTLISGASGIDAH